MAKKDMKRPEMTSSQSKNSMTNKTQMQAENCTGDKKAKPKSY